MLHTPVLLKEVIEYLEPKNGGIYIDCTFGGGGYSANILQMGAAKLIAFDRDESVVPIAYEFAQKYGDRFQFYNLPNSQIGSVLNGISGSVDGIVYDIGVSSMQIDTPSRGFSFQKEGPLDMRMDQREGLSAYDVVNNYTEAELARIIYEYGDERKSRSIAREIIAARSISPIKTTTELTRIVLKAVNLYKDDINPATRTFQALRIEVNKELEQLKSSLHAAKSLLKVKGRMVVVSFHSGEDKIVKSLFNEWCGKKCNLNKYLPQLEPDFKSPEFKFLHKGVISASDEEVRVNPRARSAKLRAIEKLI
jgi:16S rRNA (cytosine1402-N4)-methyltransferase